MSNIKLEHRYRCWNDCLMSGCPSHVATIEYQSVSDALHFKDGKGQEIYMQTPELGALLHMLRPLGEARVEVQREIDNAFGTGTDTRPSHV